MSNNNSHSGFAFFSGMVIGAAIGAIAGLLYAPESGEKTRKRVSDKTREISDELLDQFDDLKENVNNILEDVKQTGSELIENVKKTGTEVLEDVKKTGTNVIEEVKEASKS